MTSGSPLWSLPLGLMGPLFIVALGLRCELPQLLVGGFVIAPPGRRLCPLIAPGLSFRCGFLLLCLLGFLCFVILDDLQERSEQRMIEAALSAGGIFSGLKSSLNPRLILWRERRQDGPLRSEEHTSELQSQ